MNKDLNKSLEHKRHTLAHILAYVCENKYEDCKLTLGPAIDNGFYYDIDFKKDAKPNTDDDLKSLTKEMQKICRLGGAFTHKVVSEDKARGIFANNKYKLELIDEIVGRGEEITLYTINFTKGDGTLNGETFTDLCRGGHCDHLTDIADGSFKINKLAGAYWRGDEKRDQLTRIYGLAFESKEELESYEAQIEEAKKRDHRVLGRELGLFIFSDLVGPGLPMWTPGGTFIRNKINDFVQELRSEYNYGMVTIPHITKSDLYKKSGHWEKYAEDLFKIETRDGHILCIKPMNCPHHAQIYSSELRSYKELPIRYSETTMVYRDEQSGEINGLSRVLSITQDDAHVFCRESQLEDEINNIWNLIEKFYSTFGFTNLTPRFSRRDDDAKFKGSNELWTKAETAIKNLLDKRSPGKWVDGEGEAAFYGPKVDFMAKDAIGRTHQVGTIQVDFVQPTNFGLDYVDEEGKRDMPVMIHCAVAGSLERFMSVYIEHTAGNFPLWLTPTQISIIPVRDNHKEYSQNIYKLLKENNIRAELADESNGLGKNVRHAKTMKYPYWLVLGDNEMNSSTITLESRTGEKLTLTLDELLLKLKDEIVNKK
jgi:threonyl-tRNA synthetase